LVSAAAMSPLAETTIDSLLNELRDAAWDERDKGDRFERLIASYLRTDPLYVQKYDEVWRWSDWPDRPGVDTGIDLVARERETGELCAIQCKFYDPSHTLQKDDIDSFFTASGKEGFTSRLIVSTTDKWSKHAEDALEGQQVPVSRLRVQDLDESGIDWSQFSLAKPEQMEIKAHKSLRPHQELALQHVVEGLSIADRGKLIMACGTGKTFTSLRIAERLVPRGGSILFLVPSISLLSQALKEWAIDAVVPLRTYAVCSDVRVGKRTKSEDIGSYDLAFPATTNAAKLHEQMRTAKDAEAITVVFSTYQSIQAISDAQKLGMARFDLVVCDEAHRTTGVTLADDDESYFVRVHDNEFLQAKKRLYMTATPRIYDDASKGVAKENDAVLCSMDNESLFGPEMHRLGFGEAVGANLLTDYKVLVLAVDETYVSKIFQNQLADRNHELQLDDAAKIVGCWNGLSKRGMSQETFEFDIAPMRRAVAFSRSIKDSQRFTRMFNQIIDDYAAASGSDALLQCEVDHVDGTFNALKRNEKLDWLKESTGEDVCRILSNARCLSEGVDVPGLDAVMFLNPRNSVVDVVQSVGRVMRRSPGKEYGYVILPIGVPSDQTPEEALKDNQKYKVVWQVLQALRAHDDRFNALINKIDLNRAKDDQLQVIGVPGFDPDADPRGDGTSTQGMFSFPQIDEWRDAIYAKIVQKVGDRRYWETWAKDVSQIAERHTARIRALLESGDPDLKEVFAAFLDGLRRNLNDSITEEQAIEMLSQHSVTRPVFEALFEDYSFATHNPVSIVMQEVLDVLDRANIQQESESLEPFYESVRRRAAGIDNAEGKQRIIVELYEKFFKLAFPRAAESLGIVYTPVEIVDFIIRSVESVLGTEFDASMSDRGVHVLDPFTGTGTFIVRLLQNGVIRPEDMREKYLRELHSNEIVLLAYYIAAINIEATYHGIVGGEYEPFEGIVLTDTFQSSEADDSMDEVIFPQNNARLVRQKQADITVIMANPPYSVGQGLENDDNKNLSYPTLDGVIRRTYAANSGVANKRNLYDSYVRAFRWASDRIGDRGIVCFVSNGSFIDSGSFDGFRKSLAEEFSAVYCFNLRGNQRTSGETSLREGGKVFGQGSRTPVAITLLVKNPDASGPCTIKYHDIGDYLTREEKLRLVEGFGSVAGVPWQIVEIDASGDWINKRDETFALFTPLGDKKNLDSHVMFAAYSLGIATHRDDWAFNFSRAGVIDNMGEMISFYDSQIDAYAIWLASLGEQRTPESVEEFIDRDPMKISWTVSLKGDLRKAKRASIRPEAAVPSMYRPFCKQWLYFDRQMNERVYQIPKIFPTPSHENILISLNAADARKPFGAIVTDVIPNLALSDPGQCFPLYFYEEVGDLGLFSSEENLNGYIRRDSITDATLNDYKQKYGSNVVKEDIFYYVYAVLHSPEYVERYAADLGKMIPRIPMAPDFWAFSRAGRELAEWHLGYETVELWPLEGLPTSNTPAENLRVEKMRFAGSGRNADRSTIVVNRLITLRGIPAEAYDYRVNGKSAIEWIMDRYEVKVDKDSGIRDDPNLWSEDPRYIVDLVARIVRVSIETMKIVDELPPIA
jgi:predicted helicase